jgi:TolB-like protein/class 3 adenylate cyclase
MKEQRRLAAIVSADVAGYSRLMGADESGTLAALKAIRREVVDPKIEEHGGRIVKTTGDGLLLEFPSVVNAVRCVLEVQTAMAERNGNGPLDRCIAFRVGINLGDIIIDGDDIFGDGVNVAARLQEVASAGGMCVSGRVYEDVRDRLEARFEDAGEQSLKNIVRPVRVWRWRPAVPTTSNQLPGSLAQRSGTGSLRGAIVVLPFIGFGSDPSLDSFVDAVTENLITDLSRIYRQSVIARNTAFTYKGNPTDVKQIGRQLGVRYVLEGSIQKSVQRLRVNTQLIDAETGVHLWAERFDTEGSDAFAVQDEVTARIARAVMLQLSHDATRQAEEAEISAQTVDTLCALGWATFRRDFSRRGWMGAAELFERALSLDAKSTRALSNLAFIKATMAFAGFSADRDGDLRLARQYLERTYAIRPRNDGNLLTEAFMCVAQKQLTQAWHAVERIGTGDGIGHLVASGVVRLALGMMEEALSDLKHLLELSPRDPDIVIWQEWAGRVCICLGNHDDAIGWLHRSLSGSPRYDWAHLSLASAYAHLGQPQEAGASVAAALALSPDWSMRKIETVVTGAQALFVDGLRKAGLPE